MDCLYMFTSEFLQVFFTVTKLDIALALKVYSGAVQRSRSFDLLWHNSFTSGKTPAALICSANNYHRSSAKKPKSIDEKVNIRVNRACHKHANNIYGIPCYFM